MIVAVTGGRNFNDVKLVEQTLCQYSISLLVHGGCRGLDMIADQFALSNGIPTTRFDADWETYGPMAGPIRNRRMLTMTDVEVLLAFPGGKGTANCVSIAKRLGIRVVRINKNTKEEATCTSVK